MPQVNGNSGRTADSIPDASTGRSSNRRFGRRFIWFSAIVIVVCVLASLCVRDFRAAKKLELIVVAANEYAANVHSYAGRFEASSHSSPQGKSQDSEMTYEFAVDMTHHRFFHESRELVKFGDFPGTTFRFRRVTANDGVSDRNLTYSRRAPQSDEDDWGEPHSLFIDQGRSVGPRPGPWYFVSLVPSGQTTPLAKQFEDGALYGKLRYEGMEEMNGALCDRVTVDYGPEQMTFWLDPACGYLPRRQQFRDKRLDVFEFQQFSDETSGATRWFPTRGRYDWAGDVTEITVKELKMNPTLDAKTFQIDAAALPDGVQVIDIPNNRKTTYTGGREDLWKARDQQHEAGMKVLRERTAGTK